MHLPAGFLARLGQCLEEILPVHIVQVDVLAAVATAHYMIHGTKVLDAQLAGHCRDPGSCGGAYQEKDRGRGLTLV